MGWIVCIAATLGALVCLAFAMSCETHTTPHRRAGIDRCTLWSCAALGLMLTAMGALASVGG